MEKKKPKKPSPRRHLELIAIGESLRDVFYMIDQATVSCAIDKTRCLLCLDFAEKIPVKHVVKTPAAGNSANAAVGASRLGIRSALVTWVGNDPAGDAIRQALDTDGVDCRYVRVNKTVPTSEATILNYKSERTQLVYFQPRTYAIPKLLRTTCIYYSALGVKHHECDNALLKELKRHDGVFFTFQPGTTHVMDGLTKPMERLIARADLFILNLDEARQLLGDGKKPVSSLLQTFHARGAGIVIITDGVNGAYSYDGAEFLHMPIFDGEPKERTGAGDSFAIGVTCALLKRKRLADALRWGTANSWSVVQYIGPQAGLLTAGGMRRVLKKFSKIVAKPIAS
jgi:sugar/nucleoside kinase (ribokinase family)